MERREVLLFLKSLEIAGFKSFARPVSLEIPRGIAALVGSNGSGKTNVVDAVRWCLGEQSMRDLRSQRAEDIIYAGQRKTLGAAEVAMTFEGSCGDEKRLWAELCISRRLYRSGESEYLINRNKARLRDVLGALREVGIDASRHVVVTQGMADSLLSATPAERRGLLEQAAGLSTYREQREEARQKLAATARNVETIEVILAELEPRVRVLRRQARAVEEREEARERLRGALSAWYASKWQTMLRTMEEATAEASRVASLRHRAAEELSRAEQLGETALERERAWNQQVSAAVEALHGTERDLDAAEAHLREVDGRLALSRERAEAQQRRAARLGPSLIAARGRQESARRALDDTEARRAEEERQRDALRSDLEGAQARLRERTRESGVRRREHEEAKETRSKLLRRQEELRAAHETEAHRAERAEEGLRAASRSLKAVEEELSHCEADRCESESHVSRETAALARAEETLRRHREREVRLRRLGARAERAAIELADAYEWLARQISGLASTLDTGLLASLQVASSWEQAVAAALGDWALVPQGNLSELASPEGDQTGFLAWRCRLNADDEGAVWADSVVSGFPHDRANPLSGTLLVEEDPDARRLWARLAPLPACTIGSPPIQIVTRGGNRWDAIGARSSTIDDRAARYLRLRRQAAQLETRRPALDGRVARLRDAHETAASDAEAAERAVEDARAELQQARRLLADLVDKNGRLGRRRADLERERWELQRQSSLHQTRRDEHVTALARLEAELAQQAVAAERSGALWTEAREAAEAARVTAEEAERRCRESERAIELLRAREVAQREQLAALREDAARLEQESGEVASGQRDLESEQARLLEERDRHEEAVCQLHAVVEQQRLRVAEVQARRPRSEDRAPLLRELRGRLSACIGRHERALADLTHADRARRDLAEEIVREMQTDPGSLPVEAQNAPTDDDLRRLRTRAVQYADVDPSVVDEFREMQDRQNYLRRHVEDLKLAARELERVMTSADREMRARYASAFAAVSDEFSRVFRVMLQGGDARLEQVDADGGIDVQARLPGRRARSSAAFSGGERTLVALSLLFGVLHIRPTPFCVLDEVDAALDESNVERYLDVLRDISRQTQVIVVTHNRATMAVADVLYGLTMDDDGVSNVLSLRLDSYDAVG